MSPFVLIILYSLGPSSTTIGVSTTQTDMPTEDACNFIAEDAIRLPAVQDAYCVDRRETGIANMNVHRRQINPN